MGWVQCGFQFASVVYHVLISRLFFLKSGPETVIAILITAIDWIDLPNKIAGPLKHIDFLVKYNFLKIINYFTLHVNMFFFGK